MTFRLGNSASNATGVSARLMRRQKSGPRPFVPKQLPVKLPKPLSPTCVVEVAEALPEQVVIQRPEPTPLREPTPPPQPKPIAKPKLTVKEVKAMKQQSKKAQKLSVSVPDNKITFSLED